MTLWAIWLLRDGAGLSGNARTLLRPSGAGQATAMPPTPHCFGTDGFGQAKATRAAPGVTRANQLAVITRIGRRPSSTVTAMTDGGSRETRLQQPVELRADGQRYARRGCRHVVPRGHRHDVGESNLVN